MSRHYSSLALFFEFRQGNCEASRISTAIRRPHIKSPRHAVSVSSRLREFISQRLNWLELLAKSLSVITAQSLLHNAINSELNFSCRHRKSSDRTI